MLISTCFFAISPSYKLHLTVTLIVSYKLFFADKQWSNCFQQNTRNYTNRKFTRKQVFDVCENNRKTKK